MLRPSIEEYGRAAIPSPLRLDRALRVGFVLSANESLRAQAEAHRNASLSHQGVIDDLKRQKERAEDELKVVLNDLARARAQFVEVEKQIAMRRKGKG
jgi:hypothetical protein